MAVTSNVEVGQTTYPVNGERVGREVRAGSEAARDKVTNGRRVKERVEWGRRPRGLSKRGRALFGYLCTPEFIV